MADKKTPLDPKSKADFDKAISDFAKEVKVERDIIANEQMRLMLRDAMTFTPPMPKGGGRGLSAAAHKAGMNKLANDVRRIFVPMDMKQKALPIFLRQIINAVKGNDTQTFFQLHQNVTESRISSMSPIMRKIMEDTDWQRAQSKAKNYLSKASIFGQRTSIEGPTKELRDIHDKYKNAVNGRWKKNQPIGGPQYYVGTALQLHAYIAERQAKVGRVKAGYASVLKIMPRLTNSKGASRNYGVYDAPWVDANRSSMGQFTMTSDQVKVVMEATNLIGNVNGVADEAGTENLVYGNRVKQLQASIQAAIQRKADKANRKK